MVTGHKSEIINSNLDYYVMNHATESSIPTEKITSPKIQTCDAVICALSLKKLQDLKNQNKPKTKFIWNSLHCGSINYY